MPQAITTRRYQDPDHTAMTVVVFRRERLIIAQVKNWDVICQEKKFSSFKRADEYLTYYGWKEIKNG